jgi:hypothetical protein
MRRRTTGFACRTLPWAVIGRSVPGGPKAQPENGRGRFAVIQAALGILLAVAPAVRGADQAARSADALLRLVPPDVAVVATLEGLRDHARALGASQLVSELRQVPAVRAWLDSEQFRQLERSRAQIEGILGSSLSEIRDEVLGDAVALALRLPADAPAEPSQAWGLLLLQARDSALLKRVIRVINTAQEESQELARIGDIDRSGTTYHVREFPPGANRQPEWYAIFPDGTFALSNSEALIQAVVDRKRAQSTTPGASPLGKADHGPTIEWGLSSQTRFQAVQRRLPERALARLFVDPRPLERLIARSARPRNPAEGKMLAALGRYLAAVDYAGAAAVWSDQSLILRTVETIDPAKLDPWIIRWAADSRQPGSIVGQLPSTAFATIAMHIDAPALHDAVRMLVPDPDQPKLANFETVLSGLLLGQDLNARILRGLGPGAIGYVDVPDDILDIPASSQPSQAHPSPLPLVLVVDLEGRGDQAPRRSEGSQNAAAPAPRQPTVADALDNALRTLLALLALDKERAQGRARIKSRAVAGVAIHSLDVSTSFAYAIDRSSKRVILSNSADAIARFLEHTADFKAGGRFRRLQAAAFPNAQTFGCINLEVISRLASRDRDRLVHSLALRQGRPIAEVDRDLTQVQALARLIDAAFVTSRIESQATVVERSIGVIFRARESQPAAKP